MQSPSVPSLFMSTSTIIAAFTAFILLFYTSSLLLNEWKVGVAMHEGHLRVIHVGLHHVVLQPTDDKVHIEVASLRELCDRGQALVEEEAEDQRHSRSLRRNIDLPAFETPVQVWCSLASAGASANSFFLLAWVPSLLVLAWSSIRTLHTVLPQAEEIYVMVESLGLTERVIDTAVCALWSLYWVMILIALTLCVALRPSCKCTLVPTPRGTQPRDAASHAQTNPYLHTVASTGMQPAHRTTLA